MAEIITIGEILVEIMAKHVDQRFDETGEFVGPFPSGAPAIFIDQAARCGSSAKIIAAVGNDSFGKLNLERLQNAGVDISSVKVMHDQTTGVAFVTYQKNGDRDFLYHISNAACGAITEADLAEETFNECKYFHIMGSSIYNDDIYRAIVKGMNISKQLGCKISFDPNVRKEIINEPAKRELLVDILKQSHIVLVGDKELFYLTNIEDEKESVINLLKGDAEIVVIKRGSKGATLYTKKEHVDVQAYPVTEVDPTGAGDCFGGTFLSCINQGYSPREAIKLATIAGAIAVTKKGPMEGNSSINLLKEKI